MLQELLLKVDRRAAKHYASKTFRMKNQSPVVSFTFDDVPDSAFTNGASILEEYGIRGTFYIASGICDTTDEHWHYLTGEQVRALHDRGHEIGCHTFSHANMEVCDAAEADEECRKNLNLLKQLCGNIRVTNFAYPFGRVKMMRKLQMQKRFDSCRGVIEGINSGTVDLGLLKVVNLYDDTLTPDKLQRVLRETRDTNGWLIFYTHDVAEKPSWIGCSPGLLRSAIKAAQEVATCLPIRDALKFIGYTPTR